MDERKLQLKQAKKACKRAKRKQFGLWKTLGILFLVFAIVLSVGTGVVKGVMTNIMHGKWGMSIAGNVIIEMVAGADGVQTCVAILLTAAIVLWVLFILMLILWCRGRKNWKKTPEYLDLQTLKNIIKMEKSEK